MDQLIGEINIIDRVLEYSVCLTKDVLAGKIVDDSIKYHCTISSLLKWRSPCQPQTIQMCGL